jgi:hypothetical protein
MLRTTRLPWVRSKRITGAFGRRRRGVKPVRPELHTCNLDRAMLRTYDVRIVSTMSTL